MAQKSGILTLKKRKKRKELKKGKLTLEIKKTRRRKEDVKTRSHETGGCYKNKNSYVGERKIQ